MDRRRFIVTSISAAVVGATLATDACSNKMFSGTSLTPADGLGGLMPDATTSKVLNVQYAITNIKGYRLRGRTYNGKTVGPTIVIRPGQTLAVKVVNRLPANRPSDMPKGEIVVTEVQDGMEAMQAIPRGIPKRTPAVNINAMNNPHEFNTTNLHVHGIQTIPHLFEPLGTSNPSAEFIAIQPGKSYSYKFPIPQDHPSGLHWYHPHFHGSTDVQVSNGMAGLIIVRGPIDEVPEIKAAREFFIVVQSLGVNATKSGIYEREYIAYRTPANGGYAFGTKYTMITTNGEGVCWVDRTGKEPTYKGLGTPQFNVQPGEVVRLRILNGTNFLPLMLTLPGFAAWQIGFDGVNTLKPLPLDMSGTGTPVVTPKNLFSAPVRLAMSGNRIELLVTAPKKAGTYTLSSLASDGIFDKVPTIALAQFVVGGNPVTMSIPKTLPVPTREYPVITDSDIVKYRTFTFDQGPTDALLTGFAFKINDELYNMAVCPTAPQVGTCEEWRIENATDEAHPFHLHENSFQLTAINDRPNEPMEVWDTFVIPPKVNGKNGSITIRIRFVQWFGKTVFHCHILPHEDTGMMANILMS
jgi:suppressor of ftsI